MILSKRKLLIAGAMGLVSVAPAQERPNIIIIYADDMGYGDLSCYGGDFVPTPNIDRIGAEGIRFTHYYTSAPVSSPSRAGLTTGMFPCRLHINTYLSDRKMNRNCEQEDFLREEAPSMARTLKAAGYKTGHFGKWHMGGGRDVKNAPGIPQYGFDEYVSTWESPDPDPHITATNWIWSDKDEIKRWDRSAYFVDKTIDFLKRNATSGQPCFVNLWTDDVHTPWVPDEASAAANRDYWERKVNFAPVLAELDKQVGRLLQFLEESGLDKNTLVIFSSDNGPAPSFAGTRAGHLRGTKNSLYEGGIRMPMMACWPGKIKPGQVDSTSVICAVDFFPSLCKIGKATVKTNHKQDGKDVSRALLGEKAYARTTPLFWDFGRNGHFGSPKGRDKSPHLAVREKNWKLLVNSDGSGMELYDIATDPQETNNVAEKNPKLAGKLKKEVIEWYTSAIK